MSQSKPISPYKFLDSYGLDDAPFFFGREKEIEEAYQKVFQSRILLVYGASGTGKSSLIQCGLANQFRSSDWMPINVRRGGHVLRSMQRQLEKNCSLDAKLDSNILPQPRDIQALVQQVFLDHFKPIYFIFDQFEELFIFGNREEWELFGQTIQALLQSELDIHFIFVVRGDYLEYLNEFEKEIPGFFDNRLRVEKMSARQAEESINGPAAAGGIKLEEGFAETLLQRLSGPQHAVEPTFLQVYLDKLFQVQGAKAAFRKEDLDKIGPIDDILGEFVDEQVFKMEEPKLAWSILKCFVSLDGTKLPLPKNEIAKVLGQLGVNCPADKLQNYLEELVSKRILKSADEESRLELRHDSLALKIYERISLQEKERLEVQRFLNLSFKEFQKRGTLLKEEDLAYIAPHERKLDLSAEMTMFIERSRKNSISARRKARNQRIIALLILLLALSSLGGWYYSGLEKERANAEAARAQNESEKAKNQKEIAEAQKEKALSQEAEALKQAQLAQAAENLAEEKSQRAIAAEKEARLEKQAADEARASAQLNAQEALSQKAKAEVAKAEETRLRRISQARQMALKAQQMEFPARAQLALQAFLLHKEQKGDPEEAAIFEALLAAKRSKLKDPFLLQNLEVQIIDFVRSPEGIRLQSSDGALYSWENSKLSLIEAAPQGFSHQNKMDEAGGYKIRATESGQLFYENPQGEEAELSLKTEDLSVVKISADGHWIAWGQQNGSLYAYHVPSGERRQLPAHYSAVSDLSFSPNSQQLASSGYDRMVQIWDLQNLNKSPRRINNLAFWVACIEFGPKDNLWVNTYEGQLYKFPLKTHALHDSLCADALPLPNSKEWQQWAAEGIPLKNPCQP